MKTKILSQLKIYVNFKNVYCILCCAGNMVQRRLIDNILQPIRRQNVMHSKKQKKKKIMQKLH